MIFINILPDIIINTLIDILIMTKKHMYLLLLGLTAFSVACVPRQSNEQIQEIPPLDLLISNYHLADRVCVTRVINIMAQDTLFTDAGDPGYIRYVFKTELVKILKGEFESELILTFYSSAEYSENYISFWLSQKELLIFLKENAGSPGLYAIEAGIIPYSDKLEEKINTFHRVHEGDMENSKEL